MSRLGLVLGIAGVMSVAATLELSCDDVISRFSDELIFPEVIPFPRVLSWRGQDVELVLHCGSGPSCAAATLLRVVLVHTLAYRNVSLRIGPHLLSSFAANLNFSSNRDYSDVIVDMSSAWKPSEEKTADTLKGIGGLAAPRLQEFGASAVPAQRLLLARLSSVAATLPFCTSNFHHYPFYANHTALTICSFLFNSTDKKIAMYVVNDTLLYEIRENAEALDALMNQLEERVAAAGLLLDVRSVTRRKLAQWLREDRSMLFVDFDLWTDEDFTVIVQPPPCVSNNSKCNHNLDTSVGIRVTDVLMLQRTAPELLELLYSFSPPNQYFRKLAAVEDYEIEQAPCDWVLNNEEIVDNWRHALMNEYAVVIFMCQEDYNTEKHLYSNVIREFNKYIYFTKEQDSRFKITIYQNHVNCSDKNEMRTVLETNYLRTIHLYHLLGVLMPASVGAVSMSALAADNYVPTLAYDALSPDSVPDAWLLAPTHLRASALALFVRACRWTRLAVLSEPTDVAKNFVEALEKEDGFVVGKFSLPRTVTEGLKKTLLDLRQNNARIVFINANSVFVTSILDMARDLNMVAEDEYVWIVRDWHQNETAPDDVTYYTVSPYTRSIINMSGEGDPDLRAIISSLPWPSRHITTIVDGLWLLAETYDKIWQWRPGSRNDLRNAATIRLFNKSLHENPINGVTEQLQFEGRVLASSWMYAEKWHARKSEQLGAWRAGKGQSEINLIPLASPPHDGTTKCFWRRGNPFSPDCWDHAWACALVALVVAPLGALYAVRRTALYLKRRDEILRRKLLANREKTAAELCDWRVSRSDLQILGFLGAGHFGRVSKALLRQGDGEARYVAMKELHDGASPAEESELLLEACTLASLSHPHVVRLVGVCDDGGPPLVLTEVALFGDLLEYLSARRHLAEGGAVVPEAEHVSAAALTRLAREAAAALQHLAARGVVHRDVRAANCLVDAGRALKLADFGMARRTGAAEYVCMRRAVVPVRWMAPEAVTRGAFSAASDVWALGVLLLELMTLGARPWGAAPPERVLCRVAAGERPPLPRDASPPARALTALCWAEASDRPTAEEVRAYLERHPKALRPALAPFVPTHSDDSFSENAFFIYSSTFERSKKSLTKSSISLPNGYALLEDGK